VADTGVPPQGALEQRIADVWREALGTAAVGRATSLFEAGANSMTVTRLHARLCEEFEVTLSVADLFRHPTVAAQALLLAPATPSSRQTERARDDASAGARGSRRRAALARRGPQRRPVRTRTESGSSSTTDAS
jgi:nonribosomal peptide synthetase protein BlmIX